MPTEPSLKRAPEKTKRHDTSRMVHIRLAPDLHRRLRIVVAAEDTSVQEWLSRMVEKAVADQWPNVVSEGTERGTERHQGASNTR